MLSDLIMNYKKAHIVESEVLSENLSTFLAVELFLNGNTFSKLNSSSYYNKENLRGLTSAILNS